MSQPTTTRQATRDEIEDGFRKVLEDAFDVVKSLAPVCNNSTDELLAVLDLALVSKAQLRLVLKEVTNK